MLKVSSWKFRATMVFGNMEMAERSVVLNGMTVFVVVWVGKFTVTFPEVLRLPFASSGKLVTTTFMICGAYTPVVNAVAMRSAESHMVMCLFMALDVG